jgi:hypothetical protein
MHPQTHDGQAARFRGTHLRLGHREFEEIPADASEPGFNSWQARQLEVHLTKRAADSRGRRRKNNVRVFVTTNRKLASPRGPRPRRVSSAYSADVHPSSEVQSPPVGSIRVSNGSLYNISRRRDNSTPERSLATLFLPATRLSRTGLSSRQRTNYLPP